MAPGAKRKKILKKIKINFHISKIILIFVINKNASNMERAIHNPVIDGLNKRQANFLVKKFKDTAYNSCNPTWVEIYARFTIDELNNLFDELDKLKDPEWLVVARNLKNRFVLVDGRPGQVIRTNSDFEVTIHTNTGEVVAHINCLLEENKGLKMEDLKKS